MSKSERAAARAAAEAAKRASEAEAWRVWVQTQLARAPGVSPERAARIARLITDGRPADN